MKFYLSFIATKKGIGEECIGRNGGLSVSILDVIGVSLPEASWRNTKTGCTKVSLAEPRDRKMSRVI